MASSLSNLVNNLSEGIHRFNCKYGHNDKNCKTCRIRYKYCDCFIEYTNFEVKGTTFSTHFLTTITMDLFYCCEKVFILMNIWMKKNSIKLYCLKKKIFTDT